jgi:acid phosphatase type 7
MSARTPSVPIGTRARAAASPRTILLWIVVIILVALVMHALAPWVLPARINEGPLVQMATENGVTLVWYLTRPAPCYVTVTIDGRERIVPARAVGTRCRARIDGLEPGTAYPYVVRVGQHNLTSGLAFQTNRNADERFTFLVFGDSGKGTRAQYALAAWMLAAQPPADFILHTGDLVYSSGQRSDYEDRFFTPYRRLLSRIDFWPCLGNHDVHNDNSLTGYQEVFELPENGPAGLPPMHNYWFDYAACRIAVIDSNAAEAPLRDAVAPWLQALMAANPAPRWRFVAFHHPPYTAGRYLPDATLQAALVPAIESAGVDIVFNGHDHGYQRTQPLRGGKIVPEGQGVVYIVTGAGGAELYTPKPVAQRPAYVAALNADQHSFTQVTIDGDDLTLRQIIAGGKSIDELKIHKTAPATETEAEVPASEPAIP